MRLANHQFFFLNDNIKKSKEYDYSILYKGTSIYEVIRIIDGKTVFFEEHYTRLINSANSLNIEIWLTKKEILHHMKELAGINNVSNGNIELIFHLEDKNRTFLCLFIENKYPNPEEYENGVPTDLYFAERNNPTIKSINLELRKQTINEIQIKDLFELLLVNKDGYITEGSRSNIFLIKDDIVWTTPVEDVLPGITREKVILICKGLNCQFIEKPIHVYDLTEFDAAFYTGTSPKVIPISNIGKLQLNPTHPILKNIIKAYDEMIYEHLL